MRDSCFQRTSNFLFTRKNLFNSVPTGRTTAPWNRDLNVKGWEVLQVSLSQGFVLDFLMFTTSKALVVV
jgi:hypothetical protein